MSSGKLIREKPKGIRALYSNFRIDPSKVNITDMAYRSVFTMIVLFLLAAGCLAQGGGKAEPRRFVAADPGGSVVLSGTLSNAQEMEYVFAGKAGQTIVLKMDRSNLFDYRVFNEEFELETEFESSPKLELELPGTGDYLLFVRKKMVAKPRTATFRLTVTTRSAD